jgi:hypothetical protein
VGDINMGISMQPGVVLTDDFDIWFVLYERKTVLGPAAVLGVSGQTRASGSTSGVSARPWRSHARLLSGRVPIWKERIVYVEGDEPAASRTMTLPEFAENNARGDYLVVTLRFSP